MTTTLPATLPAEGTIITTPRGLFIDFRNLLGRSVNDSQLQSLTQSFAAVARNVAPAQTVTGNALVAEPVPGVKRAEKLVTSDLSNADAKKLRVMQLTFTESASGNRLPLSATLLLDLQDREAKSAALTLHAPDMNAAQAAHDLYDELEGLLNKGLLNQINMRLTTRDGSLSMSRSNSAKSTFTLRF